jgi:hypothetical protein
MKTTYTIEPIDEERESFGPYRYRIFRDDQEIALYRHDYRGDTVDIRFLKTGRRTDPPFGRCTDFLTGGGPEPLGLTERAKWYLDEHTAEGE